MAKIPKVVPIDVMTPIQGSGAEPELGACFLANFFKVGPGGRVGNRVTKTKFCLALALLRAGF